MNASLVRDDSWLVLSLYPSLLPLVVSSINLSTDTKRTERKKIKRDDLTPDSHTHRLCPLKPTGQWALIGICCFISVSETWQRDLQKLDRWYQQGYCWSSRELSQSFIRDLKEVSLDQVRSILFLKESTVSHFLWEQKAKPPFQSIFWFPFNKYIFWLLKLRHS